MPVDIYIISNIINWISNLLALVIALCYCYRDFSPCYLRVFPIYLFLSFAAEVLANCAFEYYLHFKPFSDQTRYIIYNLFTLTELCSFSWFLYQVIRSRIVKKILIALLILFGLYFLQYYWLKEGLVVDFSSVGVVLEAIIIMVPCLTFFRELFTRAEPVDLMREPSFWLVTGIFFYVVTIFPLYLTRSYLYDHGFAAMAKNLHSINNFAIGITYLLFIRAFTCRTKK
jgi:hypothetical protein